MRLNLRSLMLLVLGVLLCVPGAKAQDKTPAPPTKKPVTPCDSFFRCVKMCLKKLDELGIADNTIVMWSTDNGAEVFSWPDGGTFVGKWISSFKDFPPRQKPASFSLDEVMAKLEEAHKSGN